MTSTSADREHSPASPLQVLYVVNTLEIGGTEGQLANVVQQLDRARWAPSVYTLSRPGPLAVSLTERDIPVYSAQLPKILVQSGFPTGIVRLSLIYLQLLWHLIRHKPRIVHFYLPASYMVGMAATYAAHVLTLFSRRLPARVMSRRSLNFYQRKRPFVGLIERQLHTHCSAVVGNSKAVIADLRSEGAPSERLHLIYNGIEIPNPQAEARQNMRATLQLGEDALVVTMVANLLPYKGHADLLEAFAKARREVSVPMNLCLVGRDGGIGTALRAKAEQLAAAPDVRWLGERSDVPAILAVSDIGVLSSHEEGFSNAVLEGMAAGLPMVVTRVGGNSEAVVDEETGLIVEPQDSDEMARALVRLASDSALRARLGEAGRERVKSNFGMKRCIEEIERLYASIVAEGERR